ncbi:olfactory receptor 1019-like [Podarcis raffonei]|uniref:olfactory receptor 1019-like n=1 Tax=Podarcis raffonei TaxID=65483 RepID=UPI0023291BB7|nr:olfactory receptor 1019-like [Podarcis raffonei]XP_053255115.1 olfactory receptor 1019-like [Podarcis raffonei]
MEYMNQSIVTEFILLGFMDHPKLWTILFLAFILIYIVTVSGNLGIIILAALDANLHTPMYFFLSNLSLVDVGYSTTIAPRLLMTFLQKNSTISFTECSVQFFFFCLFVTVETCLLAVMAYDRFTAICNPLLYFVAMSKKLCLVLVTSAYICGFVNSAAQTSFIFSLSFCSSNVINHFFCDVPPILKLSCSSTAVANTVHFIFATSIIMTTLLIILISYTYIIFAILRIRSAQGRHKAFSTCASHFMAVTIFYGTIIFMYLRPNSGVSNDEDKIVSVFYTLVIPMLNPMIYSLRNKDVKDAFIRTRGKISLN